MERREAKPYLTYALNKDGKLVHIDSVPNGKICDCVCPHCKGELIAKNGGEQKMHHFAHSNGADCSGAIESALHIMAKEVLQEAKSIFLPSVAHYCAATLLHFETIEIEPHDKTLNLRPDCIGKYEDKMIWIEFKRSHAVDKRKKGKIISARIDCIEIDLNGCALDPNELREFLINQTDKRIWIYNTKWQYSEQKRGGNGDNEFFNGYCCYGYGEEYGVHPLERTFALDERKKIVQIQSLDDIDMNTHTYYCLVCGKEMSIDVGSKGKYFFAHIDDDIDCSDEHYLTESARAILFEKFHSSNKFEISISQSHVCKNHASCNLYQEQVCRINKFEHFDIKALGYNCSKRDDNATLLFSRNGNTNDSIDVSFTYGENSFIDNSMRALEIKVNSEADLCKLRSKGLKNYNQSVSKNFNYKEYFDAEPSDIVTDIRKFILYKSGKAFITEGMSCEIISRTKPSSITELYLLNLEEDDYAYNDAKRLGLWYCYKKGMKACFCELCFYFKPTMYEYICTRYKTKGTPHYPLEESPINCHFFSLNRKLISDLEYIYRYVKIVDSDVNIDGLSRTRGADDQTNLQQDNTP